MMKKIQALILAAMAFSLSHAEVKMPAIFSNNMVLQASQSVKIWGTAAPSAEITISFAGQKKTAKAGADGKWAISLDALPKNKTPEVMTVFENGKEAVSVKNVLVGEVWVTGGQSNMEMSAGECAKQGYDDAFAKIDYSIFRSFMQGRLSHALKPKGDVENGQWIVVGGMGTGGMSAISFFFGEMIMKRLDTPVGVIQTAVGGTAMRSWLPEEAMEGNPSFAAQLEAYKKRLAEYDYPAVLAKWTQDKKDFDEQVAKAKAEGKAPPAISTYLSRPPYPESPDTFRYPGGLYNAKVAPLAGYAAKGFLWYQGESDAGNAQNFLGMFETIIDTWRKVWEKPDMPFLFVQLTSFGGQGNWMKARLLQEEATKTRKNVEMAVTIDLGEEKDIHPKDKKQVAERLGNLALAKVYAVNGVNPYGPFFKSVKLDSNKAAVSLDTFGKKLKPAGELTGFEALSAGEWKPAKAKISGENIEVSLPESDKIEAIRYLWKMWAKPEASVFGQDGLPLAPFSTQEQ